MSKLDSNVIQEFNLLQTNAVEGLEQNQNTIDSQNAINNLKQAFTDKDDKIKIWKDSYNMAFDKYEEVKSKLDKIKEFIDGVVLKGKEKQESNDYIGGKNSYRNYKMEELQYIYEEETK